MRTATKAGSAPAVFRVALGAWTMARVAVVQVRAAQVSSRGREEARLPTGTVIGSHLTIPQECARRLTTCGRVRAAPLHRAPSRLLPAPMAR
jgi:hypothetical protein